MDTPSISGRKRSASPPAATIPSKKVLEEANVLLISDSEAGEPSSSSAQDHVSKEYNCIGFQRGTSGSFTEEFEEEIRNKVQEIVEELGGDISKDLLSKRKVCAMKTKSFLKTTSKAPDVLIMQPEQRQSFHLKYSQQFLAFFREWDADEKQVKKQEAKLAIMFQEQQKNLQQARILRKETLENMKNVFQQSIKTIEDLEKRQEVCFIEHGEGQQVDRIEDRKDSAVTRAQEQELGIIQKSLNSLLF